MCAIGPASKCIMYNVMLLANVTAGAITMPCCNSREENQDMSHVDSSNVPPLLRFTANVK